MASKHVCLCGAVIRTNLYEGHGLSLIIPEALTDIPNDERPAVAEFIDRLHLESLILAQCATCGTLSIVDGDDTVKFFAPVPVVGD